MDQRYAQVADNVVVNIIIWDGNDNVADGGWPVPTGSVMVPLEDGRVAYTGTPTVGLGATLEGGIWTFVSPPPPEDIPPTAEEILAANKARQALLTADAATAMAPVLVSLQLGDATDAETATARAWQAYYRALQVVDLTPVSPAWPTPPAS